MKLSLRLVLVGIVLVLLHTTALAQPSFDDVHGAPSSPGRYEPFHLDGVEPVDSTRIGTGPWGRIFRRDGKTYYVPEPGDGFGAMARKVYGDENLWYLVYRTNAALFDDGQAYFGSRPLVLLVPPPPAKRLVRQGGRPYVRAIPGDTLSGLASNLLGDPNRAPEILELNVEHFSRDGAGRLLRQDAEGTFRLLRLPEASSRPDVTERFDRETMPGRYEPAPVVSSRRGDGVDRYRPADPLRDDGPSRYSSATPLTRPAVVPGRYVPAPAPRRVTTQLRPQQQQQQQQQQSGAVGGTGVGLNAPIMRLRLTSASQIGTREATIILQGCGYLNRQNPTFAKALRALQWSYTYKNRSASLDSANRARLYRDYLLMRKAIARYSTMPTISRSRTRGAFDGWIREAASRLTALPSNQRIPLMLSLMSVESGQTHWSNFRPVVSYAGAIGTGQFMAATAKGLGINPFDPRHNVIGIAIYMNRLIKASGLRKGLARYNGGGSPPASSYAYADKIISRMRRLV